jgi:hypothetical protein
MSTRIAGRKESIARNLACGTMRKNFFWSGASGWRTITPMPRGTIQSLLAGGDRRSIGKADRVVALVSQNPVRFKELFVALWSSDAVVRMRAADAAEKVTRAQPQLLRIHKQELLGLLDEAQENELRWHLAVMVPRLKLSATETQRAAAALTTYLDANSSIVKTFALQGLADLALQQRSLLPAVVEQLRTATRSGTAAMKARARKLLAKMEAA